MIKLIEMDWEILEECAGLRESSPWGAAVGACLDFLAGNGFINERWEVTKMGLAALDERKKTMLNGVGLPGDWWSVTVE